MTIHTSEQWVTYLPLWYKTRPGSWFRQWLTLMCLIVLNGTCMDTSNTWHTWYEVIKLDLCGYLIYNSFISLTVVKN
jgi:hypothetical protein